MRFSRFIVTLLGFLHGVMVSLLFVLYLMSSYEDGLFDQIVESLLSPEMSEQEAVLALMNGTHVMLKPRQELFSGIEYVGLRDGVFGSSDTQLIDARGNCGSYTHVLGRLLQRANYEIRIAQMKCGDVWGCHILLEAKVDGRFVSLDALYDLAFINPDGSLASFEQVGASWSSFKDQVPAGYNSWYQYQDVRYTNWGKVPVVMPAIRSILNAFTKGGAETLSIRAYVLNVYATYMRLLLCCYFILIALTIYIGFKLRGKKRAREIEA